MPSLEAAGGLRNSSEFFVKIAKDAINIFLSEPYFARIFNDSDQ